MTTNVPTVYKFEWRNPSTRCYRNFKKGPNVLVEVVSPKQSITSQVKKVTGMVANNPGSVGRVIPWVRTVTHAVTQVGKFFKKIGSWLGW